MGLKDSDQIMLQYLLTGSPGSRYIALINRDNFRIM
jgi:hypothetical protein